MIQYNVVVIWYFLKMYFLFLFDASLNIDEFSEDEYSLFVSCQSYHGVIMNHLFSFLGGRAELDVLGPVLFLTGHVAVTPHIAAGADVELDLVVNLRTDLAPAGDPPLPGRRLGESCHSGGVLPRGTFDILAQAVVNCV